VSAELLPQLLKKVKALGADAADAMLMESTDLTVSRRLGALEEMERSESAGLGLRVLVRQRQSTVSTSDLTPATLDELAERAVTIAKQAPPDEHLSLAENTMLASSWPALDLADTQEPSADWLYAQCEAMEEAALATPGITNSEGASAHYAQSRITLATSNGFSGSYAGSSYSLSVSVVAGEGLQMERDYDFSSTRHRADLDAPEQIGKQAAAHALARLNPRKVATCQVPVIFDPRVGRNLLSSFASAISGSSVARGTSFLKQAMGEAVFSPSIQIIDDPHLPRGLASKPFDGEGLQNARLALVENGVLKHWLLDLRSANQLKLASNGRAARGLSSAPSPSATNLYIAAGAQSPEALMADIESGFYVTETFGMGVNLITGDYSQGAAGFWIEKGKKAYPVSEITIAGRLQDMFKQMTPANDLAFRYRANAPTLRIERMTVAGS
jgi:PmbA protein